MALGVTAQSKYESKRGSKIPPHVSIKYLRIAAKLTLDQAIERMAYETGRRYSRGAISAVENGLRGASVELIEALALAYGIPPEVIDTKYQPRLSPEP